MVSPSVFGATGIVTYTSHKTTGTLVVPKWLSAAFWPMLYPGDADSSWCQGNTNYRQVKSEHVYFIGLPHTDMIVVRL